MKPIDIPAIEARARALRAEEIRRLEGLFAERLRLIGRLAAGSVLAVAISASEQMRPVFSWNPQAREASSGAITARTAARLGKLLFRAFAWNPQARRAS